MIEVTDTGVGIKPEERDDIFKMFKDQDTIRLGLTISKEIAQKYNGDISFTSEPN